MHTLIEIWAIGGLSLALLFANAILNAILAFNLPSLTHILPALRVILLISFAFSILQIAVVCYFATFYVKAVAERQFKQPKTTYILFGSGFIFSIASFTMSAISLIWLTDRRFALYGTVLGMYPNIWIAAWFAVWGVTIIVVSLLYTILGTWTRQVMRQLPVGRIDLDSGVCIAEAAQNTIEYRPSVESTLASPPRTPSTTQAGSSIRGSLSATKPMGYTSRTKLVGHGSQRSSIDTTMLSNDRAEDNAFDRWDTSSVHQEMRAALGSSPPMTRSGLETIPGSRPDSPADALDGPFLPSSPRALQFEASSSSPPHASSSDIAVALDWSSPTRPQALSSSPPSSPPPPNFSRPTSQNANKPPPLHDSAQDMIHPLFRTNSPRPPPIAIMGTTVTASPLANNPITPKTLARLRTKSKSASQTKSFGHWKAMPSIELAPSRPNTGNSRPESSGPISPGLGSPGPSIYGDDDLPPAIPSFVLSADNRASMLDYSSRKSVK